MLAKVLRIAVTDGAGIFRHFHSASGLCPLRACRAFVTWHPPSVLDLLLHLGVYGALDIVVFCFKSVLWIFWLRHSSHCDVEARSSSSSHQSLPCNCLGPPAMTLHFFAHVPFPPISLDDWQLQTGSLPATSPQAPLALSSPQAIGNIQITSSIASSLWHKRPLPFATHRDL